MALVNMFGDLSLEATQLLLKAAVDASNTKLDTINTTLSGSITVDGPLTDAQLRAAPVPVSGTITATGGLTDTELRATPVPVSGTVTTGGLTDTQLRAVPVPISGSITATITDGSGPITVDGTVAVSGTVTTNDTTLNAKVPALSTDGHIPVTIMSALVPRDYDYLSLSYTGTDLTTVIYKQGGSGGTTVATLTLTYLSSVLQTVTRS